MLMINDLALDADMMQILVSIKSNSEFPVFREIRQTGNNIMVTCPFHKNGQERKPSFGVHIHSGKTHCFTCGYSAELPEFISNVFGKNDAGLYGMEYLKRNFVTSSIYERAFELIDVARSEIKKDYHSYVPECVLEQYRYTHPYLYKRGMTDEVIELFDLGYDIETDCITFPVLDKNGNCLFVARRSVSSKYFNFPNGVYKPLYGLYQVLNLDRTPDEIIVCESMFNCLTCWKHHKPAIALNGTGSAQQILELGMLPSRSLIIATDPDEAGRAGAQRIAKALGRSKILYTFDYKDSRDLNDLSDEEFLSLKKIFL